MQVSLLSANEVQYKLKPYTVMKFSACQQFCGGNMLEEQHETNYIIGWLVQRMMKSKIFPIPTEI